MKPVTTPMPLMPTTIHPKVAAATIGGAAAAIIVWVLVSFGHIEVPGYVGAAISTVCSFACGYFKASDSP